MMGQSTLKGNMVVLAVIGVLVFPYSLREREECVLRGSFAWYLKRSIRQTSKFYAAVFVIFKM